MSDDIFPIEKEDLRITPPADYAAGPLAIKITMDHLVKEMGPIRAFKAINAMNKKGGFDCPGCAWPDPDDRRSVLGEYCENGAKALAEEATLSIVDADFFASHSIYEMRKWSGYKIGKSGRLTQPMIIRQGDSYYKPISWAKTMELIATEIQQLASPDEAVFYTSGRSSNEAAYLYGLLARRLGTNNLPDCSNMCHESSGVGLSQTVGIGKGSVTLDDLHKAEVIIIIGQNPGTNHPRMLTSLQKAKKNGTKVITINPLEEAGLKRFRNPQHISDLLGSGTAITDVFLQVRINEDIALLNALMIDLINAEHKDGGILDSDFIIDKTTGYDNLKEHLDTQEIEELLKRSGVDRMSFDKAVALLKPARKIIICWAMGLTQHKNGVDNIKSCVNLLLLKGAIGKEGAGTCPVRGHSNVQGDRTVGINHKISKDLAHRLELTYGFVPPTHQGYDTVEAIQAMHDSRAKIFIGLGGNLLSAVSDSNYAAAAFGNSQLTVSISTKLNRTHLYPGKIGIILPTLGRSEVDDTAQGRQKVSVENSMGKVHASAGVLPPISTQLKSEPVIISELGQAVFPDDPHIDWSALGQDYTLIRDHIQQVVVGFDKYNERIEDGQEFYLPNCAREADFSSLPGGRAQFSICPLPDHHLDSDHFLLTTIRSHDQFNTTIYGLDDRYRGIYQARRIVFMNRADIKLLSLVAKDKIDMVSHYDGKKRHVRSFAVIPYNIPEGNLAAYFPETNPLIPIDQYAEESQTPISKSIRVKITKSLD